MSVWLSFHQEEVATDFNLLRRRLEAERESSLAERKSFVRSFVKEVKVTGDEVLLTYTIPLPPEGVSEERAGVLCSVHNGGPFTTRTTKQRLSSLAEIALCIAAEGRLHG